MNQVASLFAQLGFKVDERGLKQYEKLLHDTKKKINDNTKSLQRHQKATTQSLRAESKLSSDVRNNWAKLRVERQKALQQQAQIDRKLKAPGLTDASRSELNTQRERVASHLRGIEEQRRRLTEKRDTDEYKRRSKLSRDLHNQKRKQDKQLQRDRSRRQQVQEKRDHQEWSERGRRAQVQQREQDRIRRIQERRDMEMYRQRSHQQRALQRQELRGIAQQRRARQGMFRENPMNTAIAGGVSAGAGGWASVRSSQSYMGYIGAEQALTAAMGEREAGVQELQWLINEAQKLGVFVGDITKEYGKFAASASLTTMELGEQRRIFSSFMGYGRVLNLSSNDMNRWFYALSQMMSNGLVLSQELQVQLGDTLPGALSIFANAAADAGMISREGLTETDTLVRRLKDAMANGELVSDQLLPHVADQLETMVNQGGALEEAINNTGAAFGRFRTNVWLANKTMNEGGFDDGMRSITNALSDLLVAGEPVWQALGSGMEHIFRNLQAPIDTLRILAERTDDFGDVIKNNKAEFIVLGGLFATMTRFGRFLLLSLELIPGSIEAINDSLENGWQGWDDFGEKLAWIGATVLILIAQFRTLQGLMRGVGRGVGNRLPGGRNSQTTGRPTPSTTSTSRPTTTPNASRGLRMLRGLGYTALAEGVIMGTVNNHRDPSKAITEGSDTLIPDQYQEGPSGSSGVLTDGLKDLVGRLQGALEPLSVHSPNTLPFGDPARLIDQRATNHNTVNTDNQFHFNVEINGVTDMESFVSDFEPQMRELTERALTETWRLSSSASPIVER